MDNETPGMVFSYILMNGRPGARAWIRGNGDNPQLSGWVNFFYTPYEGILIESEIFGLPDIRVPGSSNFYGMHIHQMGDCSQPFDKTGEHYDFEDPERPHPQHSGDMIPLFSNQGYAWSAFYDKRITIPEIIGRSVVIHAMADDFTTQPSGNSGMKIGCGVIR